MFPNFILELSKLLAKEEKIIVEMDKLLILTQQNYTNNLNVSTIQNR